MKDFCRLLIVGLMAFIVVSCSTTRLSKNTDFIGGLTEKEYMETILSNHSRTGWDALTAKMSLSLDVEGKTTKVNGNLRIKKGEVIQMSIVPLLGIEVARAEISPNGMLIVDRVNRRYVQVSFEELRGLVKADLDFHTLQALFMNELFLPGKEELSLRDISAFDVELLGADVQLEIRKSKRFTYRFITQISDALLKETFIGLKNTSYGIDWHYDNFRTLEQLVFPSTMHISLEGTKKPVNATFSLSRLSTNSNWETQTKVSEKYKCIPLGDLLIQLLKK